MRIDKSFRLLRCRLVIWYTGVIALVLGACGFVVYEAIARTQWINLEQDLEAVTEGLHERLIFSLKQPGHLAPSVEKLFPVLCVSEFGCSNRKHEPQRDFLATLRSNDYYVRLLDPSGRTVAYAGNQPKLSSHTTEQERWQTLQNFAGDRYLQVSRPLRVGGNTFWGTLQVGYSLKDLDRYLVSVRLILLLGVPLATIPIGGSSYWLTHLAMQPAYQSYKKMQQFTTDAAHELRTPLATTLTTVESALRLQQIPELETQDILRVIKRQTLRLTQLIEDLLLLSQTNQQQLTRERVPCSLQDIVNDQVEEFGALAKAAGVTLTALIQQTEPLVVLGNEEQLYRLMANLINNAIKYTPSGEEVLVVLARSEHQAVIQVRDRGIGIASQEQALIFDRFYRVNTDRSRQTGGAGLGLAIALAIAIAHDGSLKVQSQLGEGSKFTLQLPLI